MTAPAPSPVPADLEALRKRIVEIIEQNSPVEIDDGTGLVTTNADTLSMDIAREWAALASAPPPPSAVEDARTALERLERQARDEHNELSESADRLWELDAKPEESGYYDTLWSAKVAEARADAFATALAALASLSTAPAGGGVGLAETDLEKRLRERSSRASENDRRYERPMTWEQMDALLATLAQLRAALTSPPASSLREGERQPVSEKVAAEMMAAALPVAQRFAEELLATRAAEDNALIDEIEEAFAPTPPRRED